MSTIRPTSTGPNPTDRLRTKRRRSFAVLATGALLATGVTVAPSLLTGTGANAATVVQGKTWLDLNKDGVQQTTADPNTNEVALAGVLVTVTATTGEAKTATTAKDTGAWLVTMSADGPYRVEFGAIPPVCPPGRTGTCATTGPSVGGTTVQFPGVGQTTVNLGVFAKSNGYGELEALTAYEFVEIGDRVWVDTNGNGIQDPGEPGIAGVTVGLRDQFNGDTIVLTTTTDTNGYYLFKSVPGVYNIQTNLTYSVVVDSKDAKLAGYTLTKGQAASRGIDSDPIGLDANGLAIAPVGLRGPAENDHTYDFGWIPPVVVKKGGLGDRVWVDTNCNGIQGIDTYGIDQAIVNLLNEDGTPALNQQGAPITTKTDSKGNYLFADLDADRKYIVEFLAPTGSETSFFRSAKKAAGSNDNSDSDADVATGRTDAVAVRAGDPVLTVDSGWCRIKPRLGDRFFEDVNADGNQDEGEPGIVGARVELLDASGSLIRFTTTDGNGKYLFDNLDQAIYQVRFFAPAGCVFTKKNAVDYIRDSNANADGSTDPVNLTVEDLTIDAGCYRPVVNQKTAIGNFVFDDLNRNGIQDEGEPGIEGVTVTLLDRSGNAIAGRTQVTRADGSYLFTDLDAGTYSVQFGTKDGYVRTAANIGDDALDSDADATSGRTGQYTLLAGQPNWTVDAGLYRPVVDTPLYTLGDRVWEDTNADGINGNGSNGPVENGVPNVKVELFDPTGKSLGSKLTDSDGRYTFTGLPAGKYRVQFTAPAGRSFTTRFAGTDRGLDSNADGSGSSGEINLTANDPTIDAGILAITSTTLPPIVLPTTTTVTPPVTPTTVPASKTVCIGDKVFTDPGSVGGVQAKDGKGIPGVTVTLVRVDNTTVSATTDANGNYKFCGLTPDVYSVKVAVSTLPKGATNTYDLDGDRNNETRVLVADKDNLDLDFGYIYPTVQDVVVTTPPTTVAPAPAVVTPPTDTPVAFTGSESTQRGLLALSMLLMGVGLVGITRNRRNRYGAY